MNQLIVSDSTQNLVQIQPANIAELANKWVSYVDASPRTIQTYSTNIRLFLNWISSNGIANPTRADIISYRDALSANHRPTTVSGYMASVRLFFQFLESEGLYQDVARHVKAPKIDRAHKHDYLTSNQARELLETADSDNESDLRDRAIIALMLTTGIRTISVINANYGDISTDGDAVVLHYLGKGHSEKSAFVKLTSPVETAIRKYLAVRGNVAEDEPLFASVSNRDRNGRLTTKSIRRLVKTRLGKIGLGNNRRLTAHSLRHTAATLNLLNGGSLEETQQMLDHASITTTQIYAHHLERMNNKSEQRVSDAIFQTA